MNNSELAKEIVEKIVAEINGGPTLEHNLEMAIQDAVMKSVVTHAKRIIREECSAEGYDTGELSRGLNISCDDPISWERELVRRLTTIACKELRQKIEITSLSESATSGSPAKPFKYELLLG